MSYIIKTNNTLSRLFEIKEIISPSLDKYLSDHNQISVELGKSIQNKSFTPDEQISYLANNKKESLWADDERRISRNLVHLNILVHDMINLIYY